MKNVKLKLDTFNETIQFEIAETQGYLNYNETLINSNTYHSLAIQYDDDQDNNDDASFIIDLAMNEVGVAIDKCDITQPSREEINEKVNECTELSNDQKEELASILFEYRDVFKRKLGLLKVYTHRFQVTNDEPYFIKQYPIPLNHKGKVRETLQSMLKENVIRRSTSNYINPIVISIKKDGSVRVCLDARF